MIYPPIPPCAKCSEPVNSRFFPISFTCESCRQRFCYSCRNGHICSPVKDDNPAGQTAIQDLLARVKVLEERIYVESEEKADTLTKVRAAILAEREKWAKRAADLSFLNGQYEGPGDLQRGFNYACEWLAAELRNAR